MPPKIELLSPELIRQILDEAFQLLMLHGVKVQSPNALDILAEAGAKIDQQNEIAFIPETIIRKALESVPHEFWLYTRSGEAVVRYGEDAVHFDPGSCGVHVLDSQTLEHRSSTSQDLIELIKISEMLPQYDAQSTAVVCNDIPKAVGDLYRLYLVLGYSNKPIVTGAFSTKTTQVMFDMLAVFRKDKNELREKPLAIFDVCPTPPLIWSDFASQSLIDLARAGIPAQIVSMPLAGAAAPVTILGSVVQHAAECLSGIVIHQCAQPGAPIVWGGAPAIFDMRQGTTPMGAIETAMLDAAYAQVGKSLGLPTHGYLGASDAKLVDVQAGIESSVSALIGALAGINMISGAGMLDFLACQSSEKLVVDAEIIAMVKRLLKGVEKQTDPLALLFYNDFHFKGDFLKQRLTRDLFPKEQVLPSAVIDRGSIRAWEEKGKMDAFQRAKIQVKELLNSYQRPALSQEDADNLQEVVDRTAKAFGITDLPILI
ncbi:MAG: trimethylamine methyltransferase family protein [Anaerolineales bacterium]